MQELYSVHSTYSVHCTGPIVSILQVYARIIQCTMYVQCTLYWSHLAGLWKNYIVYTLLVPSWPSYRLMQVLVTVHCNIVYSLLVSSYRFIQELYSVHCTYDILCTDPILQVYARIIQCTLQIQCTLYWTHLTCLYKNYTVCTVRIMYFVLIQSYRFIQELYSVHST